MHNFKNYMNLNEHSKIPEGDFFLSARTNSYKNEVTFKHSKNTTLKP